MAYPREMGRYHPNVTTSPKTKKLANTECSSWIYRVKGRPHYYSSKREEYAQIKFDLDAGTSILSFPSPRSDLYLSTNTC